MGESDLEDSATHPFDPEEWILHRNMVYTCLEPQKGGPRSEEENFWPDLWCG